MYLPKGHRTRLTLELLPLPNLTSCLPFSPSLSTSQSNQEQMIHLSITANWPSIFIRNYAISEIVLVQSFIREII